MTIFTKVQTNVAQEDNSYKNTDYCTPSEAAAAARVGSRDGRQLVFTSSCCVPMDLKNSAWPPMWTWVSVYSPVAVADQTPLHVEGAAGVQLAEEGESEDDLLEERPAQRANAVAVAENGSDGFVVAGTPARPPR